MFHRSRKVLENRNLGIEDQLELQESQLRSIKEAAEERDRMYEEVTNYNARPLALSVTVGTVTVKR